MAQSQGGVRPVVAVAFAAIGFFALLIAGFGYVSLLVNAEVLSVTGLGPVPGVVGTGVAVIVFVVTAWFVVRGARPSFRGVVLIVGAVFLAYLAGVGVGAVLTGADAGRAIAAVGAFATSWFALVLASTALIAGWASVALVRTRTRRPRWPWEGDD